MDVRKDLLTAIIFTGGVSLLAGGKFFIIFLYM